MAVPASSPRTVPMKVLGLGLSRTGTASMQAALAQLGYDHTYHGFDMLDRPEGTKLWEQAIDAKYHGKGPKFGREGFDAILWDCQAVTDMPPTLFAEELIAAYPEAKVVLVERDIESWYNSYEESVIGTLFGTQTYLIAHYVEPLLGLNTARVSRKGVLALCQASTPQEALKNARKIYREYYARIRALVPPERLLNFQLASGWEPLCEFLGDEVPSTPFPRVNESAALHAKVEAIQKDMFKRGFVKLAKLLGLPLVVAAAAFYWRGR